MTRYVPALTGLESDKLYDLEELVDRCGVLKINLLGPAGEKICLSFDSYLAYRKLDEGDSLMFLAEMSRTDFPRRSFYTAEDSEFLDWFAKQSYGVRKETFLHHSVVVTVDDVIDVISIELPNVETQQH